MDYFLFRELNLNQRPSGSEFEVLVSRYYPVTDIITKLQQVVDYKPPWRAAATFEYGCTSGCQLVAGNATLGAH
jgi:hypothetical protein